jgi:hypothetical protein
LRVTTWEYVLTSTGEWKRVSQRHAMDFVRGTKSLPQASYEEVLTATLYLDLEDRKVERLRDIRFDRWPVTGAGVMTSDTTRLILNAYSSYSSFDRERDHPDWSPEGRPPYLANLLCRWEPTRDQVERLRVLVNRRAGWQAWEEGFLDE